MVYYNEHDPFAAQWLRELIGEGVIARGEVDERDIEEVRARDLAGYAQHHWFAGIGGWSYALRLAGWPDDTAVWTGSCPCQPFSAAGKQQGASDPRHLWPYWHRLIRQSRPELVFGEQVAQAIGHGWLDTVCADLEAQGYAVGACVLGAHSVGAPHQRQRLWFVADAGCRIDERLGRSGEASGKARSAGEEVEQRQRRGVADRAGGTSGQFVADRNTARRGARGTGEARDGRGQARQQFAGLRDADWLGDRERTRLEGHAGHERDRHRPGREHAHTPRPVAAPGGVGSAWDDVEYLPCRDGKHRPTQPGLFPLAHGVPARVGTLRGAGNAIVPQVAAAFIEAWLSTRAE